MNDQMKNAIWECIEQRRKVSWIYGYIFKNTDN